MISDIIERFKAIRLEFTLTAVLETVLGVILLIWPLTVVGVLAKVIGVIIMMIGLIELFAKIFDNSGQAVGILTGLLLLVLGGWIYLHPAGVVSMVPIMIGLGLVAHGIQNLLLILTGIGAGGANWGWLVFASVITIILGVVGIACAIGVVDIALRLTGIFMIYDGLASIFMVHRVNMATRDVDSVIVEERDIEDVD